jgi:hypothetical protein
VTLPGLFADEAETPRALAGNPRVDSWVRMTFVGCRIPPKKSAVAPAATRMGVGTNHLAWGRPLGLLLLSVSLAGCAFFRDRYDVPEIPLPAQYKNAGSGAS